MSPQLPAKRHVRKGTRSCWECKRRKAKCVFEYSQDATCIGCQRRRTPCVSQTLPEELSPATIGNRHLTDRITKLEALLQSEDSVTVREHAPRKIAKEDLQRSLHASQEDLATNALENVIRSKDNVLSKLVAESQVAHIELNADDKILFEAWPSLHDAKVLMRECSDPWRYTAALNFQPYCNLSLTTMDWPCYAFESPQTHSHPMTMSRLLLIFAITLQSPTAGRITGLSESQESLMSRLFKAASKWLANEHDLSLEFLACIMLKGAFETNSGRLRQAWSVFRRAMTVAQLMGLYRHPVPHASRIEPELDLNAEAMWHRIIYVDRKLSLLLGLPVGTNATIAPGMHDTAFGMMDRELTSLAMCISNRNEGHFNSSELAATQELDTRLLDLATSLPRGFWRPVEFQHLKIGGPETFLEMLRLSAQVYYWGLLIHLHLPFLLAHSEDTVHHYSKSTCVNASREIISRFVAHRSFNPVASCSRPVDFWTLIAAMTLILAHIDCQRKTSEFNIMAHQRLSDCALLDRALESMDAVAEKDTMMRESANTIRQLLEIEAAAFKGISYDIKTDTRHDMKTQQSNVLEMVLQIPYLGGIKLSPQEHSATAQHMHDDFNLCENTLGLGADTLTGDLAFQGVDVAFFESLTRASIFDGAIQEWSDNL